MLIADAGKVVACVTEVSLLNALVNKKLKMEDPVKKCWNKDLVIFEKKEVKLA